MGGETWQVPEMGCAEATCYRSGSENKYLVAYQTCGLVSAEPGCKIVSDSSLPYPSCCPTIRCDSPILNYDSVDYEPFDLHSTNIASDELNEIDDWRSSDDVSQIGSIPSSSLSFEDQEKIVEELAKQPSKLFDILMNPQKLSDSLSLQANKKVEFTLIHFWLGYLSQVKERQSDEDLQNLL